MLQIIQPQANLKEKVKQSELRLSGHICRTKDDRRIMGRRGMEPTRRKARWKSANKSHTNNHKSIRFTYIKEYKRSMKVSHLHDCQDKDWDSIRQTETLTNAFNIEPYRWNIVNRLRSKTNETMPSLYGKQHSSQNDLSKQKPEL